jgi:hypothetical protein
VNSLVIQPASTTLRKLDEGNREISTASPVEQVLH